MPTFTKEKIVNTCTNIIEATGVSHQNAKLIAELLAEANSTGHDSHGIIRIPQYLAAIEDNDILTNSDVDILRETPLTAIIDGNWGFGQVTMSRAVEVGLEKASKSGLAAITVRNANHIGRLGSYVDHIARQGMIGLLFVNAIGTPAYRMAPWGGTEPRLVTDPSPLEFPHHMVTPLS